jgi:pSer/pThr/pTyr-binding forkhead associated (FHA) protein
VPAGQRELVGFLISYQADPLGSFWPLYSGRNLVGRAGAAEGLDISIADPTTSSNHAAFYIDAQSRATHVEDLGSTNGTFVNEDAIGPRGRRELRDNDRVRLGGFSMVIKVVPRL